MQSQSSSALDLDQVKQIIRDTELSWNQTQSPEWHLAMWRASILFELDKLAKPKPLIE
jgi:hypothetical protein